MAEIDLIPNHYRHWRSQLALLQSFAVAVAAVALALLAAGFWLDWSSARAEKRAEVLKSDNAITQQQQNQLQQLIAQQSEYERQWSLLRGLRAGAAIEDIFSIVDRAITVGDLWFLEWSFRRAGVVVDGEMRGIETGYFIIVDESSEPQVQKNLQIATHMTINGQARDHQALSKFVRALFEQDNVRDVSVQKTAQASYANGRVVDFDITIVLNSDFKES